MAYAQPHTHRWATNVVRTAWARVHPGQPLALGTLQAIRAVGCHEGVYGLATKPLGWERTKNWGAIQRPKDQPPGPLDLPFKDKHADGTQYIAYFKGYPTYEDAAADLVHELTRRLGVAAVLDSGDYDEIAKQMRASKYFEDSAEHYASALKACAAEAAAANGEQLVTPGTAKSTSSGANIVVGVLGFGLLAGAVMLAVRETRQRIRAAERTAATFDEVHRELLGTEPKGDDTSRRDAA